MPKIFKTFLKRIEALFSESETLHQFLREQVLVTLCTKVPITMGATIIVASSLLLFLWPYADHLFLGTWYVLVLVLSLERVYYALKGCRYGDRSLEARYQRFRVEAVTMAFLWAVAAFVFYPEGHLQYELLLGIIVAGMAGGGAITLAIDRKIADTYIILVLSAFALRLIICWDELHTILFLMTFVFMTVFLVSTRQLNKILEKGIRQHGELGELRRRLDLIADQAPVGILYFDTKFNIIDCNKALTEHIGVPKETLLKLNLLQLKDQRPIRNIRKVIEEKRVMHYEGPFMAALSGRELWVSAVYSPLLDQYGRLIGGLAVVQDKTAEHEAMERAEFLAYHDTLTHLPNRKLLEDRYRLQIAQAARGKYFSALLFLDLDRFKHINDTYGHNVGDELLKETADRLQKIMRQSDTVCRLGGDEFIIFLPMISKELKESVEHTWQVTKKIHKELAKPYLIDQHQLYITTSIGAVMIYGMDEPLDEILRIADIAMYHAKKRGQGVTSFYEEEMDRELRRTIKLEHDLRHAIDRKELFIQYQPIIDIDKERIYGAEALLRWKQPDGTVVMPSEFIPVAEESKLIHQIGHWVIETVCSNLRSWQREGEFPLYYISINISSKQFRHQGFYDEVMAIISKYAIDPRLIKFEITESILMEESERTRELIEKFNNVGIGFLIDDFGTGYSSLSYLKRFEFESIKIDQSFIRDILTDEDDVALVRAMVDIARQFKYSVVAEGVESVQQKNRLKAIDATIFCQGYYYSAPLDEKAFLEKVRRCEVC
ncbi:putative bifunctional diguanylate cyclase/phosphodiesterase [Hydrogenimonas urashimensis]|uniref:putative bifunctional diguanylate cyclase/phosphodiesterase n=1 Tax=Hydrogenimonas urashimensis TaxID=2740515 RepID=UPI0019156374|nr:EAL domain-containing protein [Hydrogenimonas urashimensis]